MAKWKEPTDTTVAVTGVDPRARMKEIRAEVKAFLKGDTLGLAHLGDLPNNMEMAVGLVMFIIVIGILGTFFGGVAGWIVGLFFTDTIMQTLNRIGVDTMGMTMWQLGATLGFISGFFKTTGVRKNG